MVDRCRRCKLGCLGSVRGGLVEMPVASVHDGGRFKVFTAPLVLEYASEDHFVRGFSAVS